MAKMYDVTRSGEISNPGGAVANDVGVRYYIRNSGADCFGISPEGKIPV